MKMYLISLLGGKQCCHTGVARFPREPSGYGANKILGSGLRRGDRFSQQLIIILCLLGLWPCSLLAQEIRVGAGVADGDIYVGETFQYQVIIEGYQQSVDVDLSNLKPWSPSKAGERDFSSERISIVNGRQSRVVEKKYVMAYSLVADSAGDFTLPPVTVTVAGKEYQTNPVPVEVIQPAETDSVKLKMELASSQGFVGQPLSLKVHWYLDRDVGEYYLNVPALRMPNDFVVEDVEPIEKSGQKMVEIKIGSKKALALMYSKTYQGRQYTVITFETLLVPKRAGKVLLDAPHVSCDLVMGRSRQRQSFFQDRRQYQRFQAKGESIRLEVLPLPEDGRPESFTGLVGRYEIEVKASPVDVNVGDPITLQVEVRGDLLKSVGMPDLNKFSEDFKIPKEQSRPTVQGKEKKFVQTIRVNHDGVTEIPPIPLSYFDVDQGKYVTVTSNPIALQVAATEIVSADQAVGNDMTVRQSELEAVELGVAANYEGPEIFRDQSFNILASMLQPVYLLLYLGPLLLVIGVWLVRLVAADDPLRQSARRRDQSLKRAQGRLQSIRMEQKGAAEEIGKVLRGFVSDLYNRKSESLTAEDCRSLLALRQCDDEVVERFCQLLDACDQSRYGGGATALCRLDVPSVNELLKLVYHGKK